MSQADSGSKRDPFDLLAESFLERFRRGERPSISEYIKDNPDHADDIRDLFPALVEVEQLKSGGATDSLVRSATMPTISRLGDYQILGIVGEGGMGIVYEAIRESLKSRVALKIMHPRYRDHPGYLRRFHVEACAAASLHHTNIVSVFDYGETDGVVYYAMPYIAGQSLEKVLQDVHLMKRDQSPELAGESSIALKAPSSSLADRTVGRYYQEVARLGAQVALALAHAHQRGILHRDIKPSNLLIDALGNVWVTDFGLAKFEEGADLSRSRDLVGTLRYMAPERLRGVSSRASDLYSLGATLYEMLTLHPPFDGRDQPALMYQIAHEQPLPLRRHDVKIPRDLETIVLKALAKDPRDRFSTAELMAEELRRFTEGRPIQSRSLPAYERLWRWCKRNPGLASLNALAVGLVITLAVAATFAAYTFRSQRNDLATEQQRTRRNLARAEQAEKDLRTQLKLTQDAERMARIAERRGSIALGNALLTEGVALQRGGMIGQRFDSVDRLMQAARILRDLPEGRDRIAVIRDHLIAAMGLTDLRITSRRPQQPNNLTAFDQQFERYAYVDERTRETVIRRVADGNEEMRLPAPEIVFWYATASFSHDGRHLRVRYAVQGEHGVTEIWNLARRQRVFSEQTRADASAFHPDGRHFFYAPAGTGLAVWDFEQSRVVKRMTLDAPALNMLAVDPVRRRLASNDSKEHSVHLFDIDSGRELERWDGPVGRNAIAFSGDGRLLASGDWNGSVFVWDTEKRSLASTLAGHAQYVGGCLFAPPSHLLVTSSWDDTLRIWDASLGRELLTMKQAQVLGISPDGNSLAVGLGESELALAEIAHCNSYQVLNPAMVGNRSYDSTQHDMVRSAAFSPDGRLLAIALSEGLFLYHGGSGAYLGHLATGPCDSVLFDQASQTLISSGNWGLYRWPIRWSRVPSAEPVAISQSARIGPPELLTPLALKADMSKAAWLPDQKTLAFIDNSAAQVRLIDTGQPRPCARPFDSLHSANNHRMTTIAVSPDGKWAACGGWKEMGISIWDLSSRKLVRLLEPCDQPTSCSFFVTFTPDGKRLISSSLSSVADYYAWDVGTWERQPLLPERGFAAERAPVFSPDGTVMCLWASQEQVRLIDVATSRTLANLANQLSLNSTPISFSPDGTRLVAGTRTKIALLWDLKQIRAQLRAANLDWDAPPYDDVRAPATCPIRLQVLGQVTEPGLKLEADLARADARLAVHPDDAEALMMRGAVLVARGQDEEAIRVLGRRHDITSGKGGPDQLLAYVLNRRARFLLNASPSSGSSEEPVELARRAVELSRAARAYVNTLGIALCRAGRDAEAIPHLEDSLARGFGQTDPQDLYFLAIAHHRLGHVDLAKASLARALSWQSRRRFVQNALNAELGRFRAEAEAILKLPPSQGSGKEVVPLDSSELRARVPPKDGVSGHAQRPRDHD